MVFCAVALFLEIILRVFPYLRNIVEPEYLGHLSKIVYYLRPNQGLPVFLPFDLQALARGERIRTADCSDFVQMVNRGN